MDDATISAADSLAKLFVCVMYDGQNSSPRGKKCALFADRNALMRTIMDGVWWANCGTFMGENAEWKAKPKNIAFCFRTFVHPQKTQVAD